MSETETVHPDWDAERVAEHMANLRESEMKQVAIHDALSTAADDAWREVCRLRDQIEYCQGMFSKPKGGQR